MTKFKQKVFRDKKGRFITTARAKRSGARGQIVMIPVYSR
jgi:hypothetical protein